MTRHSKRSEAGFTIVELMIATLVFSVILLVITYGVLSFTKSYYKGLNTANTQDTARTVTDLLSQSLQFNGGAVDFAQPGGPGTPITTFCLGGKQYDFVLDTIATDTNHVLYQSPHNASASCVPKSASSFDSTTDQDLLAKNMRLAAFEISPPAGTEGLFTIHVKVIYGETDLLDIPVGHPELAKCATDIGSQFCAVADLTTTVEKRVK